MYVKTLIYLSGKKKSIMTQADFAAGKNTDGSGEKIYCQRKPCLKEGKK